MLKQVLLDLWRKGRRRAAPPPGPSGDAACGWARHAQGDTVGAERHARRALALGIDVDSAYLLLAVLELPGVYYTEILAHIHEVLLPRTYVEIGVFKGTSMALAGPGTDAIGIEIFNWRWNLARAAVSLP